MRVERKCLICNQKYYHPDQDQLHEHGGEGRKSEHGGVEVASPSHIEIPNSIEKSPSEKKIKKIPKKVDKRSREYRQSIGR